jgi:hypothetical protein
MCRADHHHETSESSMHKRAYSNPYTERSPRRKCLLCSEQLHHLRSASIVGSLSRRAPTEDLACGRVFAERCRRQGGSYCGILPSTPFSCTTSRATAAQGPKLSASTPVHMFIASLSGCGPHLWSFGVNAIDHRSLPRHYICNYS